MQAILAAALAGLMATPHCAGMCGGFATACARPAHPGSLWAWHAGRLTTYAVLGALAGSSAGACRARVAAGRAGRALLVWFAAALAGVVPQPSARIPGLARAGQRWPAGRAWPARYLFGTVTGLLPCGMVYAALSIAIAAGTRYSAGSPWWPSAPPRCPASRVLSLGVQRFALRGSGPAAPLPPSSSPSACGP
jgi:uncharacterized protein